MARTKTFVLVDDIDGQSIDIDDAHTISWSWRGVDYELDVSRTTLFGIEHGPIPFAQVLSASTRVGGRKRKHAAKAHLRVGTATGQDADTAAIRAWAAANVFPALIPTVSDS